MYLASRLAGNLGLDEHTQTMVRSCAILHDAGPVSYTHLDVYKRQGFMADFDGYG